MDVRKSGSQEVIKSGREEGKETGREVGVGETGGDRPRRLTFKLSLICIRYFLTQNIRNRSMQSTEVANGVEQVGTVPGVEDKLAPCLQGLLVAHRSLGNPVLLCA